MTECPEKMELILQRNFTGDWGPSCISFAPCFLMAVHCILFPTTK